jgi:spore coat polysaccharide biosynthesis protein SpsF (cytidylyltransferase family)
MSRVVCVLQARMGSSRLPGKSLRILQGRPMIGHVVERIRAVAGIDDLVLATSARAKDDLLVEEAGRLGVCVVRGSEDDVLERMHVAAALARAEVVVRITGDCPFLDPEVVAQVLDAQDRGGWYAWNDTARSGFPDGTDAEAFPFALLEAAAFGATRQHDREHVTPWIRTHYPVATVVCSLADYSWLKLSVDTEDDWRRAQEIARRIPTGDYSLAATVAAYQQVHA